MQRLKTRPQFQATMSAGTIARTPHFALHRMELVAEVTDMVANPRTGPGSNDPQALFGIGGEREQAWLGAMVPKRWARRAVTRNAIKRQIYTVGATFEARLPQAAPGAVKSARHETAHRQSDDDSNLPPRAVIARWSE